MACPRAMGSTTCIGWPKNCGSLLHAALAGALYTCGRSCAAPHQLSTQQAEMYVAVEGAHFGIFILMAVVPQ